MFAAPTIYPVIDSGACARAGLDPVSFAEACLRGGARVLQLRQKEGSSADFLDRARRLVRAAARAGAQVIVNDRADIAALSGAAGVHVGQEDVGVDDARRVVGPSLVVGLSTHTAAQVDRALAGSATYVAVGPVYGTLTKDTGYGPSGLDLVRQAAGRGKPIVAIGGITLDSVPELVAAGATGLAVISDLVSTGDPERRVREYVRLLQ
jgi:thiamine-phosphate pyrophosphorylase